MRVTCILLLVSAPGTRLPLARVCTQRSGTDEGLEPTQENWLGLRAANPQCLSPPSSLLIASAATQQDRTLGQP